VSVLPEVRYGVGEFCVIILPLGGCILDYHNQTSIAYRKSPVSPLFRSIFLVKKWKNSADYQLFSWQREPLL